VVDLGEEAELVHHPHDAAVRGLRPPSIGGRGDLDDEKRLNGSVEEMVREYKKKFPDNLTLLQAECDLAARHGDYTRAVDVTQPEPIVQPVIDTDGAVTPSQLCVVIDTDYL